MEYEITPRWMLTILFHQQPVESNDIPLDEND